MGESIIQKKSFEFALEIIQLYRELEQRREYVLSKQLLRSGTSIGANVEEASAGQSRNDFLAKMSIASKEARETKYCAIRSLEMSRSTQGWVTGKRTGKPERNLDNWMTMRVTPRKT